MCEQCKCEVNGLCQSNTTHLTAYSMVSHKAGPLKQAKKAHKHGKHRSKGALSVKGKTGVVSGKGKSGVVSLTKKDR